MVALSSFFSPTTISGIQWPLGPGSSPALHFQSLQELQSIRKPKGSPIDDVLKDLPGTVEDLFPTQDAEERHFGKIALALLLLGYGYTDECHNLITPMSWPDDIHFAHGPSVYSQVSPSVKAFASYTHCLVHRREAFNVGEFGMLGFGNANYWSNAVQRSENDSLPHAEWRSKVVELANRYSDSPEVQAWCQKHGFVETTTARNPFFESRAVHELCATVERNNPEGNPQLLAFAEQVASTEVQILLRRALEKAGYSTTTTAEKTCTNEKVRSKVDETTAILAMKAISSAHLNNFMSDGSIVLRRVVKSTEDEDALSASAGIASRLLQSPGCKLQPTSSSKNPAICVMIPTTESGAATLGARFSMDLAVGDCYATILNDSSPDFDGVASWTLEVCTKEDLDVIFLDPWFGTRGETPTTVIQWSKGTIF